MKILKRDPLFEKVEKALLRAYQHIPAELEAEKKRKSKINGPIIVPNTTKVNL